MKAKYFPRYVGERQKLWEEFRDAEKAKSGPEYKRSHRSSFLAGFDLGIAESQRAASFLKAHEDLQQRSLELQAEVTGLTEELERARASLLALLHNVKDEPV